MSMTYILGNLAGRAIVSFVLVWMVCLVFSRFDWRLALQRSGRWYSFLAMVALSLLGMGSAVIKAGGIR